MSIICKCLQQIEIIIIFYICPELYDNYTKMVETVFNRLKISRGPKEQV